MAYFEKAVEHFDVESHKRKEWLKMTWCRQVVEHHDDDDHCVEVCHFPFMVTVD